MNSKFKKNRPRLQMNNSCSIHHKSQLKMIVTLMKQGPRFLPHRICSNLVVVRDLSVLNIIYYPYSTYLVFSSINLKEWYGSLSVDFIPRGMP